MSRYLQSSPQHCPSMTAEIEDSEGLVECDVGSPLALGDEAQIAQLLSNGIRERDQISVSRSVASRSG